jgi:hypothetical protein
MEEATRERGNYEAEEKVMSPDGKRVKIEKEHNVSGKLVCKARRWR